MAEIKGLDGLTNQEVLDYINNGAKFVVFQYTISIVVMTFKRSSSIYFKKKGESTTSKSIGFTILTFIMGWWGIPWGPIYTIGSLFNNMSGGKDVTQEVLQALVHTANQNNANQRQSREDLLDDILED